MARLASITLLMRVATEQGSHWAPQSWDQDHPQPPGPAGFSACWKRLPARLAFMWAHVALGRSWGTRVEESCFWQGESSILSNCCRITPSWYRQVPPRCLLTSVSAPACPETLLWTLGQRRGQTGKASRAMVCDAGVCTQCVYAKGEKGWGTSSVLLPPVQTGEKQRNFSKIWFFLWTFYKMKCRDSFAVFASEQQGL